MIEKQEPASKRPLVQPLLITLALLPLCAVVWARGIQVRNEAEHRRIQSEPDQPVHHFHKNRDGKKVYIARRYKKWSSGFAWTVWIPDDGRQYQLCMSERSTEVPDHCIDLAAGNHAIELTQDALSNGLAFCLVIDGIESAVTRKPKTWSQTGMSWNMIRDQDVYAPESLQEVLYEVNPKEDQLTNDTGIVVWVRAAP